MTDARIIRTRAALHGAILQLATEKPVPNVTVSELADLAGINRVTFYKHFSTTAEALGSALSLELDEARKHFVDAYASGEQDPVEVFRESIIQILDHIDRHRQLYLKSIQSPQDGTIPNMLADHFTTTLEQYLAQRVNLEPKTPEIDIPTVARFFGTGLVGAIKAWVVSGAEDREAFVHSVQSLAPDWWFPQA
ncbi:MAG: TetR/AcrR family transcriptional regulator [Leucobacter sp.]